MNRRITPEQVEAAKLRIIIDRKLNRETPDWVTELSKQTPSRRNKMAEDTDAPDSRGVNKAMTLQDDITWYANEDGAHWVAEDSDVQRIAAGLERDYHIVKRDQGQQEKPKYNNGGYIPGHETKGRRPDHLTRAFLKTDRGAYMASTIPPRLSRKNILESLTDNGSTFPEAEELLDERDDRIRRKAVWSALVEAADSMPEMKGAAYMFYVRTWLHNRAKDAFRGDA